MTTTNVLPADLNDRQSALSTWRGPLTVGLADNAQGMPPVLLQSVWNLITPNVGPANVAITASTAGASLTSGNGQDVIVNQENVQGTFTLGATIVDNGATAIGMTKSGPGTMIVPAGVSNSYSGPTFINRGTLQVSSLTNGGVAERDWPIDERHRKPMA